ncbi:MAG: outer membrane beta-barrel protein [Bacteroidia bacterium]|nr:outer membrane beta-barrel protein [Bacteroidia bacterium]NNK59800.1 outer membrane beta-barrel protein [Flavobacteriaceae bacterium]
MSDKKHIDRLFQEKLKDFEASPSPAVWEHISSKLEQPKKDRKLIPLWWKVAGIAAGIVLLISIGSALLNGNDPQVDPNTIVNTEDTNSNSETNNSQDAIVNDLDQADDKLASEEMPLNTNLNDDSEGSETKPNANNRLSEQNKTQKTNVVTTANTTKTQKLKKEQLANKAPIEEQNAIVDQKNDEQKDPSLDLNSIDEQKANDLIKGNNKTNDALTDSNEASTKQDESDSTTIEEDEKLSLTEETLNEDEKTEDAVVETEDQGKRWRINPNIAPVYFNSFGSGSSIDDQFVNNSRSGEINMSYGVGAAYELNSKLSLRAGINQVKLGYSTNNVVVYNNIEPSIENNPLKNVALNANSQDLSFLSGNGLNFAQVPGVVSNNIKSSIDQELGFIEVPVEVEYKISDKKLGVSVIGGFSTLFLNQNEVYSSLQGDRTLLGEATNIKKTSFSANFGVGVNYNISKQIDLNLEPVLKYQLNTFENTSGSFNPYFFGIYTGFSFKF